MKILRNFLIFRADLSVNVLRFFIVTIENRKGRKNNREGPTR